MKSILDMTRGETIDALRSYVPNRNYKDVVKRHTPYLKALLMYYVTGGSTEDIKLGGSKRRAQLPSVTVKMVDRTEPVVMGYASEDIRSGDVVRAEIDSDYGVFIVKPAIESDFPKRDTDDLFKNSDFEEIGVKPIYQTFGGLFVYAGITLIFGIAVYLVMQYVG